MQFTNTSTNMVQAISNIINGYKMGAMRALAQEPVQNALDAKRKGTPKVVVEYRLLWRSMATGEPCYMLTVTDSGTVGLRGDMVTTEELERRDHKLLPEENWAAFEAQGYTKESEDALGSRGQGKAAFLYHSHVPGPTRRMLMLYDTLLESDEYRLGMRFARPVDQTMDPPLVDEKARAMVRSDLFRVNDELAIPLKLKPLRKIGTRIIVPFLDEADVRETKPYGELSRWLQRCWWRAIQLDKLEIRIVDDTTGQTEVIAVPAWWRDLPRIKGKPSTDGSWCDLPDGGRSCVWGNLPLEDGHKVRRLVLLHSDAILEDEISKEPEWSGIQLLRHSQWIETYGAREEYGDLIPAEKRAGFRGYVEFAKHTESALRHHEVENSQHDRFNRRKKIISDIRNLLTERVRDFSHEMGWKEAVSTSQQTASQRDKDTYMRFLKTFLNPNGRKPKPGQGKGEPDGKQLIWDLRLDLGYPDPKSARVDWGQAIRNVYVEVSVEPGEELIGSADLVLEWVDATGESTNIIRKEATIGNSWGEDSIQAQFQLGDWQIHRGHAERERVINCPNPGEYRLRAAVEYHGERVKSAARTIYVQTKPPLPPEKNPITLSISAVNADDGEKRRIDHGEVLHIEFKSRNRMPDTATVYLNATFCDEVFARGMPVDLAGTPAGDTSTPYPILTVKCQLLDPLQSANLLIADTLVLKMPESSGTFRIRADLLDAQGNRIANSSKPVYFQRDPSRAKNELPFEIRQESQQKEMWKLNRDLTELTYPGDYPLRKELPDVRRQNHLLQGKNAFIAEISANGLLEWALRPKQENGDDSNYDQLRDSIGNPDDPKWEPYIRRLEKTGQRSNRIRA
ncbi:MAG: hypothetical protein OXE95_06570 [Chloroflexi bacterium]|nr:hypothetical protein [Chloroflexota bacterium]MCY4247224.1 hypothetical protein [Chloroflexota bacterium]